MIDNTPFHRNDTQRHVIVKDAHRSLARAPRKLEAEELDRDLDTTSGLVRDFTTDMDRAFNGILPSDFGLDLDRSADEQGEVSPWIPTIEASEQDGTLVVRAELPGMTKDDIHVDIAEQTLTIHGERREELAADGKGWLHSEVRYGSFFRSIPIPAGVDPDSVEAEFESGVLEVRMPTPEQVKTSDGIRTPTAGDSVDGKPATPEP